MYPVSKNKYPYLYLCFKSSKNKPSKSKQAYVPGSLPGPPSGTRRHCHASPGNHCLLLPLFPSRSLLFAEHRHLSSTIALQYSSYSKFSVLTYAALYFGFQALLVPLAFPPLPRLLLIVHFCKLMLECCCDL